MREELLKLAFEYRKTKLWTKMYDTDLFALEMEDGVIGYVSIMGQLGQHNAIAVYPGEEGIQSFLNILLTVDQGPISPLDEMELALGQHCLQLSFEDEIELIEGELEEIRSFKRAHHIRAGGEKPHPVFRTYEPYRVPQPMSDPLDFSYLKQAIEAAIYVGKLGKRALEPFKTDALENDNPVPLLIKEGDGFQVMDEISIPVLKTPAYQPVVISNDFLLRKVKKHLKKGADQTLECNLAIFPEPILGEDDAIPKFPHCLFSIDRQSGMALPPVMTTAYLERPEETVSDFLDILIQYNVKPRRIVVPNERTYQLLLDVCEKLGIEIELGETEELDHFEMELLHRIGGDMKDEMDEIIDFMMSADPIDLVMLPEEVIQEFERLLALDALPSDVSQDLKTKIEQIRCLQ